MTFAVYRLGTKCSNQVANGCTGSCKAWRQTRMNFLKLAKNYIILLWD